jgi:hypothetical protein
MEKTIVIDGKEMKFKATAATPRVYRQAFGRDIYIDVQALYKAIEGGTDLPIDSLNAFENVAFCMNSQAEGRELKRESIEKDMDEWLEQFDAFSIYKILPQLIELWRLNTEQKSVPKK